MGGNNKGINIMKIQKENKSLYERYDRQDNFVSDIYYNLINLYKDIKKEYPDIANSGTLINSTKKAIELISSRQDSLGLN